MALADATAGIACLYALDPTGADESIPFSPLVQFSANLMRNTDKGLVRAEARMVNKGRSLMTVETTVKDEAGRLLLLVTSTHFVLAAN